MISDFLQYSFITQWIIRIIMFFYIPRRQKNPITTLAWLMVIMMFPWFGLILYLVIGAQQPPKYRLEQKEKLKKILEDLYPWIHKNKDKLIAVLDNKNLETSMIIQKLGGLPPTRGNSVEFISNPYLFIEKLTADIDSAEHHVNLLYYIFENDDSGKKVINALERAAERGVTCRLLVDSVGSKNLIKKEFPRLKKLGINAVGALPMISFKRYLGRIDWRTHRKIAVIDGKTAYTGSQNIINPDYGHRDPDLVWRDLAARLQGPVVLSLQRVFLSDWFIETDEHIDLNSYFPIPEPKGDIPIQVLPSGPIYSPGNYERSLINALYHTKNKVIITSPYFIPDEAMMHALETACRKGVEINIILPEKSDQFLPGYAARSYFEELMEMGIRIHLYTDGLLHAKSASLDKDISFFGSSNFDIRSFYLDFEIDLVFYEKDANLTLRAIQEGYLEKSVELNAEEWKNRGFKQRSLESIARLTSPML